MMQFRDIHGHPNYKISSDGMIVNKKRNNVLKPWIDKHGYYSVILNRKCKRIHVLVFEAFYRRIQPNEVVHHISGNKLDNSILNLVAKDRRLHISEHNLGRKNTQYQKQRVSETHKGKRLSFETIAKREQTKKQRRLNNPNYGKAINHIPWNKGKHIWSEEDKQRLSQLANKTFTGKKQSQQTKRKKSESLKKYWERIKLNK